VNKYDCSASITLSTSLLVLSLSFYNTFDTDSPTVSVKCGNLTNSLAIIFYAVSSKNPYTVFNNSIAGSFNLSNSGCNKNKNASNDGNPGIVSP